LKKRMICLALACLLAVPARAGGAPRGYLALTFDDGPSGSITKTLLDGLRARDVHATFFVCAYRVEQFPDTLVQIAEQGHEIGLHSVCHTYMDEMTAAEVEADLVANREIVTEVSGVSPRLFRPPGGLYSRELTKAAAAEGLSVVLWSVDPRDWDPVSRKTAAQSVVRGAEPGSVILMHDLSEGSVRAALQAVDELRAEGYEFCTVSELAELTGHALVPGGVYSSFPAP